MWRQSTFAYCSQGVQQIFTAPVYRTHCAVIFAIAQLSCNHFHLILIIRNKHFALPFTYLKAVMTLLANSHAHQTDWLLGYKEYTLLHCYVQLAVGVKAQWPTLIEPLARKQVACSIVCFYARQHICYSAYMPRQFRLSVCLSVRLSVCPSVCHTRVLYQNG